MLCTNESYPYRTALVRAIGRLDPTIVGKEGLEIMKTALLAADIEVRDAAVVSLELWATPESIDLLRSHRESVPWLAEYVRRAVEDLG